MCVLVQYGASLVPVCDTYMEKHLLNENFRFPRKHALVSMLFLGWAGVLDASGVLSLGITQAVLH